jgi:retron-type reverse transcriptase
VQRWILESVLARGSVEPAAHGFVTGRSIVSNAVPHVGAAIVVNLDLEEFFPTLTYRRVKGLFVKLGYAEEVATILALLCTEPRTVEVGLDGQTWHVARTPRFLPQGAPTSPMVTNLICRRLDRRLCGLARSLGWIYTRYADDLTFSGPAAVGATVGGLLASARRVVEAEGFRVHPRKTRVLRRGRRQEVTGLVVNDRLGVPRVQLRKFRALLYQIEKDGPAGKTWGAGGDVLASARGFASYVAMVDPARGAALRARVERLAAAPRPAR